MIRGSLEKLQKCIGYSFSDENKLSLALTHRSMGGKNNERYEFLGDSILNFVIAAELFSRMPGSSEGDLSRFRSSLVKGETLAERAREIDLGDYLFLGAGEMKSGGFRRDSTLADAFEAVLGAVFLDGGFDSCRMLILKLFQKAIDDLIGDGVVKDPKTMLQEYVQASHASLPQYDLIEVTGKDHEQSFKVTCSCELYDGQTEGVASSRKSAEKIAAEKMLNALKSTKQ